MVCTCTYGCDLMPQQRGLIDPKLNSYEFMRRRNVTEVILDPKSGDTGSVSPGVGKSLRSVQRERDDLTTSTLLAIDPTTARKSMKEVGEKLTIPAAPRYQVTATWYVLVRLKIEILV